MAQKRHSTLLLLLLMFLVLEQTHAFFPLKWPKLDKYFEVEETDEEATTSVAEDDYNPFKLPKLFNLGKKDLFKPISLKDLFSEKKAKDLYIEEKIKEFFEDKKELFDDKKELFADKKIKDDSYEKIIYKPVKELNVKKEKKLYPVKVVEESEEDEEADDCADSYTEIKYIPKPPTKPKCYSCEAKEDSARPKYIDNYEIKYFT